MNQPARDQLQIAQAARTIALQMLQERGRGAVLVGAARVDAALERLLQAVLLPAPGSTDPFFQPDRPLGSFGARIILAARLGLIEPPVEQALQTLRRVRNVTSTARPQPGRRKGEGLPLKLTTTRFLARVAATCRRERSCCSNKSLES